MAAAAKTWDALRKRVQTQAYVSPERTEVIYRGTTVYRRTGRTVRLYAGSWLTATTKSRMNDALRLDGIPWRVYSERFCWYAGSGDKKRAFFNTARSAWSHVVEMQVIFTVEG